MLFDFGRERYIERKLFFRKLLELLFFGGHWGEQSPHPNFLIYI
jgi:hypothetical protein